jgi:hypothetical protein
LGQEELIAKRQSDCSDRQIRFLASVLAKPSPPVLDPLPILVGGDHQWVGGDLVHDRLRLVRRRHDQDRDTASLVAVGALAHLLGFGMAQLVTTAAWPIAILGSVCLDAELGWAGYRLWQRPTASDVLVSGRPT